MPESYTQGNQAAQHALVNAVVQTAKEREYSQMALLLEMLAESFSDKETQEEITKIKKTSSIEFGTFELLYKTSFRADPRRAVVLKHPYYIERVPFPRVRQMFELEVITPLSKIAIKLVGRISVDKSLFLQNYIKGHSTSKQSLDTVEDIKSRKVEIEL